MQSISLTDTQKVRVTAQPEDAENNPGVETAPPTWASSATAIASITDLSVDGLGASVQGVSPGTAIITVTGTNATGTFTTAFNAIVTGGPATQFNFVFGVPA